MLELWEDTSTAAAEMPADERHYVRALFNGKEVTICTPPGKGKRDTSGTVYDYSEGDCEVVLPHQLRAHVWLLRGVLSSGLFCWSSGSVFFLDH